MIIPAEGEDDSSEDNEDEDESEDDETDDETTIIDDEMHLTEEAVAVKSFEDEDEVDQKVAEKIQDNKVRSRQMR